MGGTARSWTTKKKRGCFTYFAPRFATLFFSPLFHPGVSRSSATKLAPHLSAPWLTAQHAPLFWRRASMDTALCEAPALPPFDSGVYAHLQDVTAEGPCCCIVPCRSAPLSFWSRCRTSPSPRGGLVAFAICLCLRAGPRKKTAWARIWEPTKKLPPRKKKPRTGLLHCKKKERGSGRIDSCIRVRIRVHAELLAFDPRAFSSLLTRELSIWFYARHRNFVGLTYIVFSVEFGFRVEADWSCSCTEIAGLWTHVHSFPLAAFDGGVGVVCLVLLLRFFGFVVFGSLRLYNLEVNWDFLSET